MYVDDRENYNYQKVEEESYSISASSLLEMKQHDIIDMV